MVGIVLISHSSRQSDHEQVFINALSVHDFTGPAFLLQVNECVQTFDRRLHVAVVCFMAPATFLTSLGLIEAAMVRTNAVVSPTAGVAISATSRTEGSPKVLNRIARMACFFPMFDSAAH